MPVAVDLPVRPSRPAVGARPVTSAGQASRRVVVLRRRRVAALVFTVAALLGAVRAVAAFGAGPASGPERRPPIHLVQPGETLWSIAESLDPGDVRGLVRRLAKLNGGDVLHVGQRLVLPEGLSSGG
jgi:LysM domain